VTWLVLFDVDGTLLLTHDDVYVEANRLALREVYGAAPDGADVPGDTATAHVRRALSAAGFSTLEIDAGLPRWCASFERHYVQLLAGTDTSGWQLAPGAHDAIARLDRAALLTGNPPAVAHARMERLGLAQFFPPGQGAFGCEREQRTELFGLARERAGDWPAARTVAVGDTPLDVSSAHAAGCRCIGVTTGRYARHQLGAAEVVIADLTELEAALQALDDA
jgi:phosphoglycolate phosphatase-like HAD superfamily hydrolase